MSKDKNVTNQKLLEKWEENQNSMISQFPEGLERDSGQECQMLLRAQLRNGLEKCPLDFITERLLMIK